jgi:hypothetical protein
MQRPFALLTSLAVAVLVTTACGFDHSTSVLVPTSTSTSTPSATPSAGSGGGNAPGTGSTSSTPSLVGTWTSSNTTPTLPNPSTCGNFQYQIATQTSSSISGSFTAVCGGGLAISGNLTGQLNGTAVSITVTGTASMPGIPSCPFTLSGNGGIEDNGNTLRVPFSGETCLGPVNGTEVLRRPQPAAAPEPVPVPTPTPTPTPTPPPADPTFGCSTDDKEKLVECIHDHVNPARTVEGGFEVTKRVAWALRGEGGGLLIKNGGENIISWQGYSFAAGRICYSDGHIFKVLTDVPSTNGPSWQDNDFVDRSLFVPAIDPNR